MNDNEARARVLINTRLADLGWDIHNSNAVRYEVALPDGTFADYALCDRHGRSLAVIEAKRFSTDPGSAAAQARRYAEQLGVPYIFLANGHETLFWEWQREAFPRPVKTFFKQDDLERRAATQVLRVDPAGIPIDTRIAGRDYQTACIDTLCREMAAGRRKLLVEMATGTGKTLTAAAVIKLFLRTGNARRVLFLVDRLELEDQAWKAFVALLKNDYKSVIYKENRDDWRQA